MRLVILLENINGKMNLQIIKEDFENQEEQIRGVLIYEKPINTLPQEIMKKINNILKAELEIYEQEIERIIDEEKINYRRGLN